jgi:hypothetical protein
MALRDVFGPVEQAATQSPREANVTPLQRVFRRAEETGPAPERGSGQETWRTPEPSYTEEFKAGVGVGVDQFQQAGYAIGAIAAESLGNEELRQEMERGMFEQTRQIREADRSVSQLEDIEDADDFFRWAAGSLGQVAPSLGAAFASGGIGGAIGKKLVMDGVKKRITSDAVASIVGQGYTTRQATRMVQQALMTPSTHKAMQKAVRTGIASGAFASSAPPQVGESYADLRERGVDPGEAGRVATIAGAAGGALDALPVLVLLDRFFPGVDRELSKSFVRDVAGTLGMQAVLEGSTEGAQEVIQIAASAYSDPTFNMFDPANRSRIMNAVAVGALAGAVTGAGGATVDQARQRSGQGAKWVAKKAQQSVEKSIEAVGKMRKPRAPTMDEIKANMEGSMEKLRRVADETAVPEGTPPTVADSIRKTVADVLEENVMPTIGSVRDSIEQTLKKLGILDTSVGAARVPELTRIMKGLDADIYNAVNPHLSELKTKLGALAKEAAERAKGLDTEAAQAEMARMKQQAEALVKDFNERIVKPAIDRIQATAEERIENPSAPLPEEEAAPEAPPQGPTPVGAAPEVVSEQIDSALEVVGEFLERQGRRLRNLQDEIDRFNKVIADPRAPAEAKEKMTKGIESRQAIIKNSPERAVVHVVEALKKANMLGPLKQTLQVETDEEVAQRLIDAYEGSESETQVFDESEMDQNTEADAETNQTDEVVPEVPTPRAGSRVVLYGKRPDPDPAEMAKPKKDRKKRPYSKRIDVAEEDQRSAGGGAVESFGEALPYKANEDGTPKGQIKKRLAAMQAREAMVAQMLGEPAPLRTFKIVSHNGGHVIASEASPDLAGHNFVFSLEDGGRVTKTELIEIWFQKAHDSANKLNKDSRRHIMLPSPTGKGEAKYDLPTLVRMGKIIGEVDNEAVALHEANRAGFAELMAMFTQAGIKPRYLATRKGKDGTPMPDRGSTIVYVSESGKETRLRDVTKVVKVRVKGNRKNVRQVQIVGHSPSHARGTVEPRMADAVDAKKILIARKLIDGLEAVIGRRSRGLTKDEADLFTQEASKGKKKGKDPEGDTESSVAPKGQLPPGMLERDAKGQLPSPQKILDWVNKYVAREKESGKPMPMWVTNIRDIVEGIIRRRSGPLKKEEINHIRFQYNAFLPKELGDARYGTPEAALKAAKDYLARLEANVNSRAHLQDVALASAGEFRNADGSPVEYFFGAKDEDGQWTAGTENDVRGFENEAEADEHMWTLEAEHSMTSFEVVPNPSGEGFVIRGSSVGSGSPAFDSTPFEDSYSPTPFVVPESAGDNSVVAEETRTNNRGGPVWLSRGIAPGLVWNTEASNIGALEQFETEEEQNTRSTSRMNRRDRQDRNVSNRLNRLQREANRNPEQLEQLQEEGRQLEENAAAKVATRVAAHSAGGKRDTLHNIDPASLVEVKGKKLAAAVKSLIDTISRKLMLPVRTIVVDRANLQKIIDGLTEDGDMAVVGALEQARKDNPPARVIMRGNDAIIVINTKKLADKMPANQAHLRNHAPIVQALSHELGHIVFWSYFQALSPNFKTRLYRAYLRANRINSPWADASFTDIPAPEGAEAVSFEEWMAEQFVAWVANNAEGMGLTEQDPAMMGWFARISRKLKMLWDFLKSDYNLTEEYDAFINGVLGLQLYEKGNTRAPQYTQDLWNANGLPPLPLTVKNLEGLESAPKPRDFVGFKKRIEALSKAFKTGQSGVIKDSLLQTAEIVLSAMNARIRRYADRYDALEELIPDFNPRPGQEGTSLRNRMHQQYSIYVQDVNTILQGATEEELVALEAEMRTPLRKSERAKALEAAFERMRRYAVRKGLPMQNLEFYWPRELRIDHIHANAEVYYKRLARVKGWSDAKAAETIGQMIQNHGATPQVIIDAITKGQESTEQVLATPWAPQIKERSLTDAEFEAIFGDAREGDVRIVLSNYVSRLVKAAEFNESFGSDSQGEYKQWRRTGRLEDVLERAQAQGMTEQEMNEVRVMVDTLMGRTGVDMSKGWRNAMSGMILYQNMRVLLFTVFSSLPDLATPLIRSGSFKTAYKAWTQDLNKAFNKESDLYIMARTWGVVSDTLNQSILAEYSSSHFLSSWAVTASDKFFRYTGLHAWTNFTRLMGLKVGQQFLGDNAELAKNGDQVAIDRLKEVGLTWQEVFDWGSAGRPVYGQRGWSREDFDGEPPEIVVTAEKVADALTKFVNQAVMRPDASQRPVWSSNPWFAIVWHLKTFMYAFKDIVLNRLWFEVQRSGIEGAARLAPILHLMMLLPLAALGLELRELIQYRLGGMTPRSDRMNGFDYMIDLVNRSGALGPAQMVMDMKGSADRQNWALMGLASPTISQAYEFMTKPITQSGPKAIPVVSQLPWARNKVRPLFKGAPPEATEANPTPTERKPVDAPELLRIRHAGGGKPSLTAATVKSGKYKGKIALSFDEDGDGRPDKVNIWTGDKKSLVELLRKQPWWDKGTDF